MIQRKVSMRGITDVFQLPGVLEDSTEEANVLMIMWVIAWHCSRINRNESFKLVSQDSIFLLTYLATLKKGNPLQAVRDILHYEISSWNLTMVSKSRCSHCENVEPSFTLFDCCKSKKGCEKCC